MRSAFNSLLHLSDRAVASTAPDLRAAMLGHTGDSTLQPLIVIELVIHRDPARLLEVSLTW
jgi:hypothetical protein